MKERGSPQIQRRHPATSLGVCKSRARGEEALMEAYTCMQYVYMYAVCGSFTP
jgi:hypothetical protein